MSIREITVIGMGLIGGSLGLSLKKRLNDIRVCGVDREQGTVDEAVKLGAADWGTIDLPSSVKNADLIFLATPVSVMEWIVKEISPYLKEGAVVTDVGSTKEAVVRLMEDLLPPTVHFIGGHPMAGSEKWGLWGANELLFENAAYILTPGSRANLNALDKVKELVETLGAKIIVLTPAEHDKKVAAVSHLPHVVASALVNTVGALEEKEKGYFSLAAGGFRDTTRIAASQSQLWCEIMLHNKEALLPLVKGFRQSLLEFERTLERGESQVLIQLLTRSKHWREQVPTGLKGILPQLYEITVTVPDKPGVIGELSNLMGDNNINISDIEIERVREEYGGTIRLSFSTEIWREQAYFLLKEHGFKVSKTEI